MDIIREITGSFTIFCLIFSVLSFTVSFIHPKDRSNYSNRYDWIAFLFYGIILGFASVFFGLLWLVFLHF